MENRLFALADCGCEIRRTRDNVQDRTIVLCGTHDGTAAREELAEAKREEERYRQEARESATTAGRALRERNHLRAIVDASTKTHAAAQRIVELSLDDSLPSRVIALEGELADARAEADKLRPAAEAAKAAVAYILEMHPQIRDAQRGWFHPSTLRLVAAVDKLAAVPAATPQSDDDPVIPSQGRVVGHGVLRINRDAAAVPGDGDGDKAKEHPESTCGRCGGPNVAWSAPSPLWNRVMRGDDINNTDLYGGIVCPTCFAVLAEKAGIADLWQLSAKRVHVPLQTTTPSGRTWNEQTWLWEESVTCSCKWSPARGRIWCDSCAAKRDAALTEAAAVPGDGEQAAP